MRYKYKVRELGPKQLGIQNEEYVEVGELYAGRLVYCDSVLFGY